MYKYNVYMGYEIKTGGFPSLGEIDYKYPLTKGDIVILSKKLFEKLADFDDIQSSINLKYRQQYVVGGLHHWIDDPESAVDIYLVIDDDYKH